jgi:hypothetical protein
MFCRLLPAICCFALATPSLAEESITVTVTGTLKTGIAAIGGETTGATITAREVTWELDFGKNEELRKAADKWSGQQVTVTGSLERRAGVEVKQRWIVTVSSLKGPDEKPKKVEPNREPKLGRIELPTINAKPTQAGTNVVVAVEQERTVVDIRCERGIDRCVISREGEEWPPHVVARLWLQGLESFKATSGDVMIEWTVPSTGNPTSSCVLSSGLRTTRLTAASAYFTQAKVLVVGNERPQIPLKNGYFEVPLPEKFFAANPQQITLQWIDFYR